MNCHGERDIKSGGSCALYPVISLMNHSSSSNCTNMPACAARQQLQAQGAGQPRSSNARATQSRERGPAAVVTTQAVRKGEELTVTYLSDPAAVRKKWGIV